MRLVFINTWIPENNRMRRNVAIDIGIWGDKHIVAYRYVSDYSRIDSNPDFIADFGSSDSFTSIFPPDCHPLMNIAIGSNLCRRVDRYAIWMPDI